MRRFSVPQFIEVEDKIFGPLTLKQFIYLLGGASTIFILFVFLPFFFAMILTIPIAALALALAFYKINEQSFVKILASAISHYTKPKLYIWQKTDKKRRTDKLKKNEEEKEFRLPVVNKTKLKDLAWSLDIKEDIDRK